MTDAIREIGVSEVTYYRWRQEFGGLQIEQVNLPVNTTDTHSYNKLHEALNGRVVHRFARQLHFPNDFAHVIHNADAGLLDRYVQSSKMLHAALLLLMLEAANARPRFTISLKRSTQNLQLSTSSPADYPILGSSADFAAAPPSVRFTFDSVAKVGEKRLARENA